ncbi:DEAD/DEAH box helicase [Flavobacterium branchiophilum]|uniref:Serine/threonine protein kinase n=1 Tax=Flavobacterium branchiophilum TaxID=55197 RepID=A0A2H3KY48_9FLAO|nr:DEAD/DEAH box helicase [Flavobacterium branchiophilum]PDS24524.1 serine/threonine protein kinase [Flavobacterium branchiophilum]
MNYTFCFNLHFETTLGFYVPIPYVVNNQQEIDYVDKKPSPEVLADLGISEKNIEQDQKTLLKICKSLEVPSILKKYSAKKKFKTYTELMLDPSMEDGVLRFLHFQLDNFYSIVQKNNYPLAINMDLDKNFAKHRIATSNESMKAFLKFDKTENDIKYSLFLKSQDQLLIPEKQSITLLLNKSKWMVLNKKLVGLEGINTKNIEPFLKKNAIEISLKLAPQYFENFIKNIVKKVDFEATGFESIVKNQPIKVGLNLQNDFFTNQYLISLHLDYAGYVFDFEKNKNIHSELDLEDLTNIKITRFVRNPEAEQQYIAALQELGLNIINNAFFGLKAHEKDRYQNVEWLIENKQNIENKGFVLDYIGIENKKLHVAIPQIKSSNTLKNDWFDIEMTIICGSLSFHFYEILPHLKEGQRLFLLPNDCYFLIPSAWFTTYSSLARMAKVQDGMMRLPKSNFTIIDGLPELDHQLMTSSEVAFSPSTAVKAHLRPYQIEGAKWLFEHFCNGLGACLADDMGLGKTLQTLTTLTAVKEQIQTKEATVPMYDLFGNVVSNSQTFLKALIILPSSLIFNWYNEAKKFTPHFSVIQYSGADRKKLVKKLDKYDLIFTSYAIAQRDSAIFAKYHFNYLILDESQYIKNKNSETFKRINEIQAVNKISLSGTPIENSLNDLWSQMQFINPNLLGTFDFFVKNYKVPIEKNQDEQALLELKSLIKPFVLRRTKEQVLDDLPDKMEQIYYCDMEPDQAKMYEEEKSKARNYLLNLTDEKAGKLQIINTLMRLRQLSNHPKMIDANSELDSGKFLAVTQYIASLLKANQKTIVFSSFVSNLAFYEQWCLDHNVLYCKLTGQTKPKEREAAVKRFQEQEEIKLFFISLKAGGVGLNITKASYVLFLDPWWNPFAEAQGIGRAHRIGQENKVNVVRFISKNTVEEKIISLQESKKILSNSLLDDNFVSAEIEQNLDYILT